MLDEEHFWRASEIHAHAWIRTFSEPCEPLRSPAFARIYVCPICGRAWGKRDYVTAASQQFYAVDRLCAAHGGGGLTRGRDYNEHSIASHSDAFIAFAVDQYLIDSSVIEFDD